MLLVLLLSIIALGYSMNKIVFIHLTGGLIFKQDGFAFTEGGLVHGVTALSTLSSQYDVKFLCPNPPGYKKRREIKYRGAKIICLGSALWIQEAQYANLRFFQEVSRFLQREKPDILMGNGIVAASLLRFVSHEAVKIGIIHHLYHALGLEDAFKHTTWGIGIMERLALQLAKLDKIAVISPMVKEVLVKRGFPQNDIVVVGNGVNPDDYRFSEDKSPHSLIYIGRLTRLKRVASLIEIIPAIKRLFPDVTLHIVGGGPKRDELRKKIRELGVSQNVLMHGYLTEENKIRLLRNCAVYVSNSSFEGFGIPLIEAMATGTVPVVSNIAAHDFVFQGEDVGFLVDSKEEMIERIVALFKEPSLRATLARNGRRLVEEKWTWKRVGQRYRELLQTCST